jgi:hypothetical protein
MDRMGIISIDGHVAGSRPAYREYVDQKNLDAYDAWAKSLDDPGFDCRSRSLCSVDEIVGEPGLRPDRTFCFGTDWSMFGVDYHHFETIVPDVHDAVAQLLGDDRVSDETARKVLYENAAAVYGFDLDGLTPHIERVGFTRADILARTAA